MPFTWSLHAHDGMRILFTSFRRTPGDPDWEWTQHWVGIGDRHKLHADGWAYADLVFYTVNYIGPLFWVNAKLSRTIKGAYPRRSGLYVNEVELTSDERLRTPRRPHAHGHQARRDDAAPGPEV